MAWQQWQSCGGEFREKIAYVNTSYTSNLVWDATRVQTGIGAIKLPTNTAGNNYLYAFANPATWGTAALWMLQAYVGLSGTPTSEIGLLSENPATTAARYLRIGTDRKLRLYDDSGNLILGPTTGTIPTTGLTHVALFLVKEAFPGGWGSKHAYIFLGGVQDVHGAAAWVASFLWWGEVTSAARGADLYLDDCVAAYTTTAGDAPWVTQAPQCHELAQFPVSAGSYSEWTGTPEATNKYLNWDGDELPEDDEDTSYNYCSAVAAETHHGQNRLTVGMPSNALIDSCMLLGAHRLSSGGKGVYTGRVRRVSTDGDVQIPGPESTYTWNRSPDRCVVSRPGGGSWMPADLDDLEMGFYSSLSGGYFSSVWCVTVVALTWVYHTTYLGLATSPPAGSSIQMSAASNLSVLSQRGTQVSEILTASSVQTALAEKRAQGFADFASLGAQVVATQRLAQASGTLSAEGAQSISALRGAENSLSLAASSEEITTAQIARFATLGQQSESDFLIDALVQAAGGASYLDTLILSAESAFQLLAQAGRLSSLLASSQSDFAAGSQRGRFSQVALSSQSALSTLALRSLLEGLDLGAASDSMTVTRVGRISPLALSGDGSLAVNGMRSLFVTLGPQSESDFLVDGLVGVPGGVSHLDSLILSAESTLLLLACAGRLSTLPVSGQSIFSIGTQRGRLSQIVLGGEGTVVTLSATRVAASVFDLLGQSAISVATSRRIADGLALEVASDFLAALQVGRLSALTLSTESSFSASGVRGLLALLALLAEALVSVEALRGAAAVLTIEGEGTLLMLPRAGLSAMLLFDTEGIFSLDALFARRPFVGKIYLPASYKPRIEIDASYD